MEMKHLIDKIENSLEHHVDFGGKRKELDSGELAAAVAGQAAALARLEQKMERIIGQVSLYQNHTSKKRTNWR